MVLLKPQAVFQFPVDAARSKALGNLIHIEDLLGWKFTRSFSKRNQWWRAGHTYSIVSPFLDGLAEVVLSRWSFGCCGRHYIQLTNTLFDWIQVLGAAIIASPFATTTQCRLPTCINCSLWHRTNGVWLQLILIRNLNAIKCESACSDEEKTCNTKTTQTDQRTIYASALLEQN